MRTFSTSDSSSPPIKMLLVEDDRIDHLAFVRSVKQGQLPYDYIIATSLAEARDTLKHQTFEIAILDYNLGDGDSTELFPILKSQLCPFIISTGSGDEETAARLMGEGAADYLIKDPDRNYLKVLPATVDKAIARKQAEEQISLLTQTIESVKDSIYITDLDGRLLFINQALRQICNLPTATIIGCTLDSLGQPHLTEQMNVDRLTEQAGSAEVEVDLYRPDGSIFSGLLSESCIQDRQKQFKVGVIRDITSLKQVELELRAAREDLERQVAIRTAELQQANDLLRQENLERIQVQERLHHLNQTLEAQVNQRTLELQTSEERYRSVITAMAEGVVLQQADGKIAACNASAERILGLTSEQLMGQTSTELDWRTIHEDGSPFPSDTHPAMVTLKTGQPHSRVVMGIRKDENTTTWISINSQPLIHIGETLPYAVVTSFTDITEQRLAQQILQHQAEEDHLRALTDGLTQVANRRCFDDRLATEWKRLLREKDWLSLLLLDLDFFKDYNDYYGHQAGDTCLIQLARAAADQIRRSTDLFARYGGEEFVVLLPNTDLEGAIAIARLLQQTVQALELPHQQSKVSKNVTVSIGIASIIPSSDRSPNTLITLADRNLYRAKQQGRNQFQPEFDNRKSAVKQAEG